EQQPFSRVMGTGPFVTAALRALRRDIPLPAGAGLERNGDVLIKPYCPPWYASMTAAVRAFIDEKYATGSGSFRDGGAATAWKEAERIQQGIPEYPPEAIEATIAYSSMCTAGTDAFPPPAAPSGPCWHIRRTGSTPIFMRSSMRSHNWGEQAGDTTRRNWCTGTRHGNPGSFLRSRQTLFESGKSESSLDIAD